MSLCACVCLSLLLLLYCKCLGQAWYREPISGTLQGWHQLGNPWATPAQPRDYLIHSQGYK